MMVLIVTRSQWGAVPPKSSWTPWPSGQPTGHTVHWEGAGGHSDHANCAAEVRSIQAFHMGGSYGNYIDIAYNWVVCNHGVAFEGRPAGQAESAAQKGGNPIHIAICYLGGPLMPFTDAGKAAINGLINSVDPSGARSYVIGHRDEPSCSTGCPGDPIEGWIHAGHPGGAPAPAPAPSPSPNPLPPGGIHHPTLRLGNVGPAVMELQRKLNGVSHTGLVLDGHFGAKTDSAVRQFQGFFHFAADGIVGPQTWGMLDYCCAVRGIH